MLVLLLATKYCQWFVYAMTVFPEKVCLKHWKKKNVFFKNLNKQKE